MKKILFATTNQNKISRIRKLLDDKSVQLLSLNDIDEKLEEPTEDLHSCIAVAAQKALGYVDQLNQDFLVLTQDDTLQFVGVSVDDNPGVSIKAPVVKAFGEFTDENAIKYYTMLVKKYGRPIDMTFEYGHCLSSIDQVKGVRPMLTAYSSQSTLKARMVDTAKRPELVPGYFISAIMEVNLDGKWVHYMDLSDEEKILADADIKESLLNLMSKFELQY